MAVYSKRSQLWTMLSALNFWSLRRSRTKDHPKLKMTQKWLSFTTRFTFMSQCPATRVARTYRQGLASRHSASILFQLVIDIYDSVHLNFLYVQRVSTRSFSLTNITISRRHLNVLPFESNLPITNHTFFPRRSFYLRLSVPVIRGRHFVLLAKPGNDSNNHFQQFYSPLIWTY